MEVIAFYIFAAIAVVASILVVGQRNPMHSVVLLIVSFGGLAGLYILLDAPFTAVTQIIIYAGAIMVLFLFVVMLLNVPREEAPPAGLVGRLSPTTLRVGAVMSVVFAVELIWVFARRIGPTWFGQEAEAADVSSVARIGQALFTEHAFAFEATSILILVAMVGAIVIARRER
jgi:NADH-quinone oxidoreductase subunit J